MPARLTGDKATAPTVAREVGIDITADTVFADVLPSDKVDVVKWPAAPGTGRGDGLRRRQRPRSLAQADLGLSMGTDADADVAIEASDLRCDPPLPAPPSRAPCSGAFAYNVAALRCSWWRTVAGCAGFSP